MWSYENRLVFVLALGGGVAALDGQALFYLSPFVAQDLRLNNAEIGVVATVVLLTWSLAGYAVGALSDRTGRRKPYLVATFAMFSVCSVFSGLARSFGLLFAARVLIGCAEGPVIPVSQSIMILESSPERRGFNMGIMQNFGAQLAGSLIGPLVLVKLATAFDWHAAFYVAAIPGLVVALLVAWLVREPPRLGMARSARKSESVLRQFAALFRFRNIRLCVLIAACSIGFYFLLLTFLPLYCVRTLGMSARNMSLVMGSLGAAGVVSAVLVPWLSDRFGRKPIMMLFTLGGAVASLGAIYSNGDVATLSVLVFIGSLALGAVPIFMATVPLETVPPEDTAAATGLIMALGQIFGGFAGPALGGVLADRFDLAVPLWMATAATVTACVLAMRLTETAPRVLARRPRLAS